MSIGNSAQTLATQLEYVRPELENTTLMSSKLWKRFSKNTQVKATSDRPARFPSMIATGGQVAATSLDGGDLGIGDAPVTVYGQLTSTTISMSWAYTKESELATDSSEKAIEDFATLTRSLAPQKFAQAMDAIIQGDGSNTYDTIQVVNTSGSNAVSFGVTNANFFYNSQTVDIWTALGGTKVATVQISYIEIATNTIFVKNPIPSSSVSAGYLLLVPGSAGAANTGVFGLRYYLVGSDTGNWMGLQRGDFPGQFNAMNVTVNGALTPQAVRAVFSLLELRLGEETTDEGNLFGHGNVDVRNAWENNALLVQNIDYNALKGGESADMLKKKASGYIAGYEFVTNPRAKPGYLDLLQEDTCSRIEVAPVDFYDVGGQTLFPAYGQSGGIATTLLFYMIWRGQLAVSNPAKCAYINGVAAPFGLPTNF